MSGNLGDIDIQEELTKVDKKLEEAGVDPNAPAAGIEGEPGDTNPAHLNDEKPDEVVETPKPGEGEDEHKPDKGAGSATDEDGNAITFKKPEDLAAYVQEQMKVIKDSTSTVTEKKDAEDALKTIKFFDEGWKPKDWNEFAVSFAPMMAKYLKDTDATDKATRLAEYKKIDDQFTETYKGLAKDGKVPAWGTKEAQEVDKQISSIGVKFGIPDYAKAYEVWSQLPKASGGGSDFTPVKKVNPSKAASRLISGQSPAEDTTKPKKVDHVNIHNKSMDQLMDKALEG